MAYSRYKHGDCDMKKRSSTPPTSKAIGVLLDFLSFYQFQLLEPIQQVLNSQGYKLIGFAGNQVSPEDSELRFANRIYDLANSHNLEGLIVSTSVGHLLDSTSFKTFLLEKQLPVVSLGEAFSGISSVSANQTTGMRELMTHLCDDRGFKHFAFVRGWPNNTDSAVREKVFCEELTKRGLATPDNMRVTGKFISYFAEQACHNLLDRGNALEVIVAANDEMARGVIRALTKRGFHVPRDIAVVGFDDIPLSALTVPSLSTVRQPLNEMGEQAAYLLLEKLAAKEEAKQKIQDIILETKLVIRESCGSAKLTSKAMRNDLAIPEDLTQTLEDLLDKQNESQFLSLWEHQLRQSALESYDFNDWFEVLELLINKKLANTADGNERAFFNKIFFQARQSLIRLISFSNRENLDEQRGSLIELMDVGQGIWQQPDLPSLMTYIQSQLAELELSFCHIVLYEEQHSRLLMSFDKKLLQQSSEAIIFERHELLPDTMLDKLELLGVVSLYTAEACYGHMIVDLSSYSPLKHNLEVSISSLRRDISNGIQATLRRQEIARHTLSLEALVKERTKQLEHEIQKSKRAEAALRLAHDKLALNILKDGMTGIYNRTAFDDALKREWLSHAREKSELSLLLCDVDFFKRYNDTYGHLAGDECLRQVANILNKHARRPSDVAARYGGEEFAILLPNTDVKGACVVAQNIQRSLQERAIPHKRSDVAKQVSLSIGIATLEPTYIEPNERIVKLADEALYKVKQSGRNGFRCATHNDFNEAQRDDLALIKPA